MGLASWKYYKRNTQVDNGIGPVLPLVGISLGVRSTTISAPGCWAQKDMVDPDITICRTHRK